MHLCFCRCRAVVQRNLDSAWALLAGNPNLGGCPDSLLFILEEFAVAFNNDYRGVPTDELYLARVFGDAQVSCESCLRLVHVLWGAQ